MLRFDNRITSYVLVQVVFSEHGGSETAYSLRSFEKVLKDLRKEAGFSKRW